MADKEGDQEDALGQGLESGEINRELDAGLALYAAVEPRPGLEERVLANLRMERAKALQRAWWRWSLAGAAAIVFVVVVVAWRRDSLFRPTISSHSLAVSDSLRPKTIATSDDQQTQARAQAFQPMPRVHQRMRPTVAKELQPKLDQFPSPQPLSEQEQLLARYVAQHHEEAVLIARASTAPLQEDREEETQETEAGSNTDVQPITD